MKSKIKIATILPYKENYTFSKAAAAALWVAEFYKFSKYKKNNYIFGNTNTEDHLTKNYSPTKGCIALKKNDLLILLKIIGKKSRIKIC